jgi:hypothetical protein
MSKKPTAALSANLVAVKGAAAPAPDMPGRGAIAEAALVPAIATSDRDVIHPDPGHTSIKEGELSPLNFRVPAGFRREFKTFAAQHDLKLNELLRRSFEEYKRQHGD